MCTCQKSLESWNLLCSSFMSQVLWGPMARGGIVYACTEIEGLCRREREQGKEHPCAKRRAAPWSRSSIERATCCFPWTRTLPCTARSGPLSQAAVPLCWVPQGRLAVLQCPVPCPQACLAAADRTTTIQLKTTHKEQNHMEPRSFRREACFAA